MGSNKFFSRITYFSLSVVYFCTFLFLLFAPVGRVSAFPIAQINTKTATFADKNASVITVKIGTSTLTFKRNPTPPQASGSAFDFSGINYVFELQGNTDDNCRQGIPASGGAFGVGSFTPTVAKITIPSANLDVTPPPANISGTFLFFHRVGTTCTTDAVNTTIQVANTFGATLAVPATEKAIVAPGATASAQPADSCETSDSGPLGWILCPVIDLLSTFTQGIFDDFIQPFLEDVPVTTDPSDGSYIAWQQFRLIGNIVLVGTMLAVVYAQVKGN